MAVVHIAAGQSGETIPVRVGDEIVLELEESPATGYAWDLEESTGLQIEAGRVEVPGTSRALPGAASLRRMRFRVLAPGTSVLRAKHWRPWEGEKSVLARFHAVLHVES